MTPEQLQQAIEDLNRRFLIFEQNFNQHQHAGVEIDRSAKITGGTVFAGHVHTDGTALSPMPAGWTSVKNSSGNYTITHNLGTLLYSVVAGVSDDVLNLVVCGSPTVNDFDVRTYTTAASPNDRAFWFIVVLG